MHRDHVMVRSLSRVSPRPSPTLPGASRDAGDLSARHERGSHQRCPPDQSVGGHGDCPPGDPALVAGGWFGYLLRGWLSDLAHGRIELERAVAEAQLTRLQGQATAAMLAEVQRTIGRIVRSSPVVRGAVAAMDTWMKWLRSKLVMVMAAYWSAIILLTLALEWIDRHQVALVLRSPLSASLSPPCWLFAGAIGAIGSPAAHLLGTADRPCPVADVLSTISLTDANSHQILEKSSGANSHRSRPSHSARSPKRKGVHMTKDRSRRRTSIHGASGCGVCSATG